METVRTIEELTPDIAAKSEAFVAMTLRRLSLLVWHQDAPNCCYWANYELSVGWALPELKELFFATPALSYPYSSVTIHYYDASPIVVVPEDLTSDKEQVAWLGHLDSLDDREPLAVSLALERVAVHYSLPQSLYDFSIRSFSLVQFVPPASHFIPFLLSYSRKVYSQVMMVSRVDGVAEILYAAGGKLQLCNRYKVPTDMDMKYYITALWRQAGFDALQDHLLYFATPTKAETSFAEELKEHIKEVQFNPYPFAETNLLDPHRADGVISLPPSIILQALCAS